MYVATETFRSLSGRSYQKGQEISWLRYLFLSRVDKARFLHHTEQRKRFEAAISEHLGDVAFETAMARREMEEYYPDRDFIPARQVDLAGTESVDLAEAEILAGIEEAAIPDIQEPSDVYEDHPVPDTYSSTESYDNSTDNQPDLGSDSSSDLNDSTALSGGTE